MSQHVIQVRTADGYVVYLAVEAKSAAQLAHTVRVEEGFAATKSINDPTFWDYGYAFDPEVARRNDGSAFSIELAAQVAA